ncbi:MAG: hypothetical protein OEM26_12965 [Saprospiraceae bacterium]|nr:hypothetical protein [Saprospiraceae bacterium]
MNKKITSVRVQIFFVATNAFSSPSLDSVPLFEYKFSIEIEKALRSGEMSIHRAAQYYSYIGEYAQALSIPNEVQLEWGFDTLTAQHVEYFYQFEAQDAVEAILK